ncbi:MAG TPA: DUF4336 domain-containing protein [Kofleriaceae bacterium]
MKLVTTDVWQIDGADIRMAGGVRMPIGSGLIRLADRTLLLYSPVKISDEDVGEINAEGEVRHIVAPNLFHHLYVKHAAERWPNATVHGAPGLAAKRSDLKIDRELGHTSIDSTVDVELIGGAPRINEALVFHRPSGTLLCADFLFNVTNPANLRTRFALAMMGVGGRELKQSRLWKLLAKNRDAVRASIDRVLGWPIGSILPAHGEPVTITSADLAPKLSRAYGGAVASALPA